MSKLHFLLSCLLMVTGFGSPLFVLAQPANPGRSAFQEAENLMRANNLEGAIAKYEEAIRAEPQNYKYYFQKGKAEMKAKRNDAAKASFKSTVQYKPDFTPAYSLLAKLYRNDKDYENAIFYYGEAARNEKDPKRKVQYKLLLVNLLIKTEKVYDAEAEIRKAKELDPSNPDILYYEGEIASLKGNWPQAKMSYEEALATPAVQAMPAASKAKYYYGLGVALNNLGDSEGAKKAWAKANFGPYKPMIQQQLQKSNPSYFYKIAVSYYLNNEYADAQRNLDKALEIQREFSPAYVLKAKMANKQGRSGEAIQLYKQAISIESDPKKQAPLYVQVANLQLNNGDAYGALQSLDRAIAIGGSNPNLIFLKARAEYESGRYNECISTVEDLLTRNANADPKTKAKYNFILGLAAKKLGDKDRATKAFKAALYGPYKPAAKEEIERIAKGM